jgi:hypothetical protein
MRDLRHDAHPQSGQEDTMGEHRQTRRKLPTGLVGALAGTAAATAPLQFFHGDGFDEAVAEVEAIEKLVGIGDLARFTPA